MRGNDFLKKKLPKKAILELEYQKWTQKSTLFGKVGKVDIRVLAILGAKKVVLPTFSKLF